MSKETKLPEAKGGLFAQYRQWENQMLERPCNEIWQDQSIPEKIRRILLLIKLDLGTNPHVMVPAVEVRDNLGELVSSIKQLEWPDVGIITAPIKDRPMGTWPMRLFKRKESEERIQQVLTDYSRELEGIKQWQWEKSMVFLFANQFADRDRVVGFRLVVMTRLGTPRKSREDLFILEVAPGKYPRQMVFATPGAVTKYYGQGTYLPGIGWRQLSAETRTEKGPVSLFRAENMTESRVVVLERLTEMAIKTIELRLLEGLNERAAIQKLQKLTGTDELWLEGYYKSNGDMRLYEFERMERKR